MSVFEVIDDVRVQTRFAIDRSRAFDPFLFTGIPGWRVGWQDHLSLAFHASDRVDFPITTMREKGEYTLSNAEQHNRLRWSKHILLDAQVFEKFYRNPGLCPKEWRSGPNGEIRYVYFNGTELLSPRGVVHIPCLFFFEGYLRYSFERLTQVPRSDIVSAVISDHPFK